MYFLNYLDRNALPQARLNTLEEDLNLKGVQYNTAISILFVGYLLMQSRFRSTYLCGKKLTKFYYSPLQHVPDSNSTFNLLVCLYDWLGGHIRLHGNSNQLFGASSVSVLLGLC